MRISTRARYTLRLMLDLVRHYDGSRPVHLRQIAENNALSRGYLEQLMVALRSASLVRGLSGRRGGYVLARPPEEIKLLDIIEAAIGPINVVNCVLYPEDCSRSPACESRPIWLLVNIGIKSTLERYTLADMSDEHWLQRITEEVAPLAGDLAFPEEVIGQRRRQAEDRAGGDRSLCQSRESGCGLPPLKKASTRTESS